MVSAAARDAMERVTRDPFVCRFAAPGGVMIVAGGPQEGDSLRVPRWGRGGGHIFLRRASVSISLGNQIRWCCR